MIVHSPKAVECASRSNGPRGRRVTEQRLFEGGHELTMLLPRENDLVVAETRPTSLSHPQWEHQMPELSDFRVAILIVV